MNSNDIIGRLEAEYHRVAVCHCGAGLYDGDCDNHDPVWMPCPVSTLLLDAREALIAAKRLADACDQLPATDGRVIGLMPLVQQLRGALGH